LARLRYGPQVTLVVVVVPFRVVQCQVSVLSALPRYVGACAFTRPLDLVALGLQSPVAAPADAPIGASEDLDLTLFEADIERFLRHGTPGTMPASGADRSGGRAERRRHIRVNGPFEGWRRGALDVPIMIHDLSEGGCFVNSLQEVETGRRLALSLHLPDTGWIAVDGEIVHDSPGFGFAVRFVQVPDQSRAHLAHFVATRTARVAAGDDPQPMGALCATDLAAAAR